MGRTSNRRDKDCPYRNYCNIAGAGCKDCEWHGIFERFRRKLVKSQKRVEVLKNENTELKARLAARFYDQDRDEAGNAPANRAGGK